MRLILIALAAIVALPSLACSQDYYRDDYWREKRRANRTWAEKAMNEDHSDIPGRRYRPARKPRREVHEPVVSGNRYDGSRYEVYSDNKYRDGPRVYGMEVRQGEAGDIAIDRLEADEMRGPEGRVCKRYTIRAYGRADKDLTDAIRTAVVAWQEDARTRAGERFMASATAIDPYNRCFRAETNESTTGQIIESAANALRMDGFRKRCEVVATPCKESWKSGFNPAITTTNRSPQDGQPTGPNGRPIVIRELTPNGAR
jgi:hypothetical protein